MSEIEKEFSRILQESRIRARKIMAIFRKMSGNFSSVHFSKKDMDNLKQYDRRNEMENIDMGRTI